MKDRVLVTGSNGYIGKNVIKSLLSMGFKVVANDFSESNFNKDVEFIKANIFEIEDPYTFFGKPDICIHLAWRDGFIHNSKAHIEDLSKHYTFISKLLNSDIKQISVMGSMHEVGYHEGKIDSKTLTNPISLYGIAKDTLRKSIFLSENSNKLLWLRAFYIYGNDSNNPSVFGKIVQAEGQKMDKFPINSGKNKYDFLHIDDLAKQISKASTQFEYRGIINCCSGKPVSLSDMLQKYIEDNGFKIKLEYNKYPDRPFESSIIYGDNDIIDKILNS